MVLVFFGCKLIREGMPQVISTVPFGTLFIVFTAMRLISYDTIPVFVFSHRGAFFFVIVASVCDHRQDLREMSYFMWERHHHRHQHAQCVSQLDGQTKSWHIMVRYIGRFQSYLTSWGLIRSREPTSDSREIRRRIDSYVGSNPSWLPAVWCVRLGTRATPDR